MSASVGKSHKLRVLIAFTLSSAIAMPAFAAQQTAAPKPATRTIRDLEKREVEVKPDPPSDVKAQQAIEQYRRFLELESQNDKMRAEAMRRLGDLQECPGVDVEPGGLFQDGLGSHGPEIVVLRAFGRRCQQFPQAPDRRVHGPAPSLGIHIRPEQVDQSFAAMRTIRESEEKTGHPPPGWSEFCPDMFVVTRNSAGPEQADRQHGRPQRTLQKVF